MLLLVMGPRLRASCRRVLFSLQLPGSIQGWKPGWWLCFTTIPSQFCGFSGMEHGGEKQSRAAVWVLYQLRRLVFNALSQEGSRELALTVMLARGGAHLASAGYR